jgi:hypothetical protein
MNKQAIGLVYVAAAVLFWISWCLMPGVGVTDARQIFALVSTQRSLVLASVIAQLLSAALYVPGLVGLVGLVGLQADGPPAAAHGLRGAAVLLLLGAMGSAADAVLHLLAFAMTAPAVDTQAMVPVMGFMQGPGLGLLAPFLLAFFVGGGRVSYALAKAGVLGRKAAHVHWAALAVALIGGGLAARGLLPGRVVGLAALGCVSGAQVLAGLALTRNR